jgi:hypothetical protein
MAPSPLHTQRNRPQHQQRDDASDVPLRQPRLFLQQQHRRALPRQHGAGGQRAGSVDAELSRVVGGAGQGDGAAPRARGAAQPALLGGTTAARHFSGPPARTAHAPHTPTPGVPPSPRSGTGLGTNGTTGNTVCGFISAGFYNTGTGTSPVPTPCPVNTAQPVDWTAAAAVAGCPAW